MRADGFSPKEISLKTGISVGAIKSYFHRKNSKHLCEQCGKIIEIKTRKSVSAPTSAV